MATPLAFPTKTASISAAADKLLATKEKIAFKSVDVDTMPHELRALYDNLREAMAIVAQHREAFEDAACGPVAALLGAKPGQDVVFSYRFGLGAGLGTKRETRSNALRF